MKSSSKPTPRRTPHGKLSFGDIALLGITSTVAIGLMVVVGVLLVMAVPASAATPSPVTLSLSVQKEKRETAADGTTAVSLVPAATVVPGDRLVYVLTYANTGKEPASNLVLDYPLPEGVSFRAAEGSPRPLVSADGVHFAPSVAPPAKVKALRWEVPSAVAPGGKGQVSFTATLD